MVESSPDTLQMPGDRYRLVLWLGHAIQPVTSMLELRDDLGLATVTIGKNILS